jgi:hypothetical protein
MYGLVPYQLMGIQHGIQYGHSNDQYAAHIIEQIMNWTIDIETRRASYPDASDDQSAFQRYIDWLKNWKTYIVLNGGTTNLNPEKPGTLNTHLETLRSNGIFCSEFYEPDLGDQLTSINFIVDERVFLKDKYPDFQFQLKQTDLMNPIFICDDEKIAWDKWVESIGGQSNLFLRTFLYNINGSPKFRLA